MIERAHEPTGHIKIAFVGSFGRIVESELADSLPNVRLMTRQKKSLTELTCLGATQLYPSDAAANCRQECTEVIQMKRVLFGCVALVITGCGASNAETSSDGELVEQARAAIELLESEDAAAVAACRSGGAACEHTDASPTCADGLEDCDALEDELEAERGPKVACWESVTECAQTSPGPECGQIARDCAMQQRDVPPHAGDGDAGAADGPAETPGAPTMPGAPRAPGDVGAPPVPSHAGDGGVELPHDGPPDAPSLPTSESDAGPPEQAQQGMSRRP